MRSFAAAIWRCISDGMSFDGCGSCSVASPSRGGCPDSEDVVLMIDPSTEPIIGRGQLNCKLQQPVRQSFCRLRYRSTRGENLNGTRLAHCIVVLRRHDAA